MCYSGKKKDRTVKNVLLVNALLIILFLSDTYGGRTHDKPIVDATPYPLPAGSRLLQELGFLAFTLSQGEILMPTKKPRGQELTLEQQLAGVSHLLHMEFFTGLCGSIMPTMIRAPHTVTLTPPAEAVCRLP